MQQPIRVRAKAGVLVPVPKLVGNIARYVGRDLDHEAFARNETDLEKLYPISKEPVEYSMQTHGFDVFCEIQRALSHGDLLKELKAAPPAPVADLNSPTTELRGSRSKA